jgi:hypothetical protein
VRDDLLTLLAGVIEEQHKKITAQVTGSIYSVNTSIIW